MNVKGVISHKSNNPRHIFSRGLIVSDHEEWYFTTGQVDVDQGCNFRYPGDPAGQTQGILESLKDMLDKEGWSLNDVVRVQMDLTDLSEDQVEDILTVQAGFWEGVEPKPVFGVP